MSTKAAKKSSSVSTPSSSGPSAQPSVPSPSSSLPSGRATSTPVSGTSPPSSGRRSGSSLCLTRYSRLQEKHDLQNLNDRLAVYIDKVRHLELENSRLTREVQTTQESVTREVSRIKSMYEHELSDARKLLDETAKERAKLEIDTKRLWDNNEELQSKLEKKTKDLQIAEQNLLIFQSKYNDMQAQLNQAQTDRKRLSDRERELEKELDKLKAFAEDARKHLEEETLQRIDLENNIQTLKEDISFKDQVYQQELIETRKRRQVEISEIDGRLTEHYEVKLQQSLKELRDQYESQMRVNREELQMLYENKIQNLTSQAQCNSGAASLAVEELRQMRSKVESLNTTINDLEASNNALNARIRDLENSRENERALHAEDMASLEAELSRVRDEMAQQLQDYQDLMDIKVALDLEIAAYRKLLESEEARLNISPSSQNAGTIPSDRHTPSQTPIRGGKRKRTLLEESEERTSTDYSVTGTARGDIEITEVDPQGRFVKITNKGNKEIALSGWHIVRKAGNLETSFKFHRTAKIESGGNVMVWSADAGASHEPPYNIVMKGQKWVVADCMTTKLVNNDGEEMATSERKRQKLSSSVSRHRENLGYRFEEELHHQQGDPQGEEMCRLM